MSTRSSRRLPWVWGDAVPDVSEFQGQDLRVATRPITSTARPETLFLWLCQLSRAPYSYDWLNNFGRRSPRGEDTDLRELEVGKQFMRIFTLTDFVPDESIIVEMNPGWPQRAFRAIRLQYRIDRVTEETSRLSAIMWMPPIGRLLNRQRRYALAWGDLIMMRKQLLVLRALAEQGNSSKAQ